MAFLFVFGALVAMWPRTPSSSAVSPRGTRRALLPSGSSHERRLDGGLIETETPTCAAPERVMEWGLALAAALAVVAVVFVARPFLLEPAPASDRLDELAPEARRRVALADDRDRPLAALKELEFDHRTGKVSDDDYRAQVGPLRRSAAEAFRALEVREEAQHERIEASGEPA